MNETQIALALNHIDQTKFHARINEWLDALTAISPEGYTYECDEPGRKFCRIVMTTRGPNGQRLAHAFYNLRNGDVLKTATWAAPAKHVRYNLLDDASFEAMMAKLDWSGGYLYMDSAK
jgi:hypothetical protein